MQNPHISYYFRYGKIQCVTILPGDGGPRSAIVAFMDIKSAEKAHKSENTLDGTPLQTQYSETNSGSSLKRAYKAEQPRSTAQLVSREG